MEAKPEPKMMQGTSSGATYFAFARKAGVVLGIKPYGILRGETFDVPGTTYFIARLRSAAAGDLFADEKAKKVVKLQAAPANLWDAWPAVTWEKKSQSRASTSIGIFLRGTFSKDPVELQKLLDQIESGKLTNKMADYLLELAGPEFATVTKRELQRWLESQYQPMVAHITDQIAKSKAASELMEGQIGVFGMQAAILKKVYGETAKEEDPEVTTLEAEFGPVNSHGGDEDHTDD